MSEFERPQPYIGVSGVARFEEHVALVDLAIRERVNDLGYFVMVGVQATGKTQVHDIPNKYGQLWHPVGDSIADAAGNEDSGLTKPFVHCFFSDSELTQGITNVMRRTRHYVQGLQINGLQWIMHDYTDELSEFRDTYPHQSIILQANNDILAAHSPAEVAGTVMDLPVDYVLLDPSGGRGKGLNTGQIRTFVDELYQQQVPVGVGVAGGLEARTIEDLLGPLMEDYPGLSCDAEGRLRKGEEGATELDLGKTEDYLIAWKQLLTASR